MFMAPKHVGVPGPGQGCLIVDGAGEPVWVHPGSDGEFVTSFRPQTYQGNPVLPWWHGRIPYSHGYGSVTVFDDHYGFLTEVHAGNAEEVDLHEVTLTDRDTALVITYSTQPADLTGLGGPSDGWVFEGVVQEIEIATGAVTMEWRSLEDIPVEDSHFPLPGSGRGSGTRNDPFDYMHLNSVRVAPDGDLIVSARHTCTVYKLARDGSEVHWRVGGKSSDFAVPDDAAFAWQHCAELHPDGTLSLFDNGIGSVPDSELDSTSVPRASSGLVLNVDENAHTVSVNKRLFHPEPLHAETQGSVQILADGSVFVGWGARPYATLFDPAGAMAWDARLADPWHSYRAYASEWTGTPDDAPAVAAQRSLLGGATVYASWNGATKVATWRVYAGRDPNALAPVADMPRAGFETSADVPGGDTWFAVAALDAGGDELGRSAPVQSSRHMS